MGYRVVDCYNKDTFLTSFKLCFLILILKAIYINRLWFWCLNIYKAKGHRQNPHKMPYVKMERGGVEPSSLK